jgi:hypothetical protein
MKTIYFTNNDLAKAMGLEVGKQYIDDIGNKHNCIKVEADQKEGVEPMIMMYDTVDKIHRPIHMLVDEELTLIEPKPQLTEQEITILKGRLAEGCEGIYRSNSGYILFRSHRSYNQIDEYDLALSVNHLFTFVQPDEEYSIEELLKGVGE